MTCACDAQVAERLDEPRRGLLLAGGVGLDLLGGRALEDARIGQAELDLARVEMLERRLGARVLRHRLGRHDLRFGQRVGFRLGRFVIGHRGRGDGGLEEVGVTQGAVDLARARGGPDDDLFVVEVGRQQRLGVVGVVPVARARRRAQRARRLDHLLARRAQHAGDGGAGQQQQRGAEQEDSDDVSADLREQARRGVGHDLAEVPAALGHRRRVARPEAEGAHRQTQAGRGQQAQRARAEGPHTRGQGGPQDEQDAGGHERHRRRPRHAADAPGEPVDDRLAGLAPLPAQVEREGEKDADRHQAEADEVQVALLEDRQARRPGHRRAVRTGLRSALGGLAGRGHR